MEDRFENCISAIRWTMRSMYHTILNGTPCMLVSGHDMIFNIQHETDWQLIQERKVAGSKENNP